MTRLRCSCCVRADVDTRVQEIGRKELTLTLCFDSTLNSAQTNSTNEFFRKVPTHKDVRDCADSLHSFLFFLQ